jgi:hypothetical protein
VSFVSLALGLSIAALGVLGIAWPESLAGILRQFQSAGGLFLGASFRVALGISLLLSASASRNPETLRVLGVVFLVGGLAMPFIGLEFFRSAIDSFLSLGHGAAAIWGVVALALGLFVAYSVAPRSRAA